eukprot:gene19403-23233_t
MFIALDNGTNVVTFTKQPKCPYSISNATFVAPSLFSSYSIAGIGRIQTTLPFELPTGYSFITATKVSGGQCLFSTVLKSVITTVPDVILTQAQCDGTNGTVVVGNAALYTSISLHVRSTNELIQNKSGVFSQVPQGEFTLHFVSLVCGIEKFHGVMEVEMPPIQVEVIDTADGCIASSSVNVSLSVPGLPQANFSINGEPVRNSPFLLDIDTTYTVSYFNQGQILSCTGSREFTTPTPTADVTYTTLKPTCQADGTATLKSSRLSSLQVTGPVSNPLVTDGTFSVKFGQDYQVKDTCSQSVYHTSFPRTAPIYKVDWTSSTCAGVWTITVINWQEFSTLNLISSNPTTSLTSVNGVFSNLTARAWIFQTNEKGCTNTPLVHTDVVPSGPLDDMSGSQVIFSPVILTQNVCDQPGKMRLDVNYRNQILQSEEVVFTANQMITLPKVGVCSPFQFLPPADFNLAATPKLAITSTAKCSYSNDGTATITNPGPNAITQVSINGISYSKSVDNVYPFPAGQVSTVVTMQGCSKKYTFSNIVAPIKQFAFQLNILDGINADASKKWTGLGSEKEHVIKFSTTGCTGEYKFQIPTENVTIKTTPLANSCPSDATYQLRVSNNVSQVLPVTSVAVLIGDLEFDVESSTFININSFAKTTATITSNHCSWKHSFTPLKPKEAIFGLSLIQYPTCPGKRDGIFQIANSFNISAVVTGVSSTPSESYLDGDRIVGWGLNEEDLYTTPYPLSFTLYWNNGCSQIINKPFDPIKMIASFYPVYTIVPPECGSSHGKVVFDATSLSNYHLSVNRLYFPDINGEIHLLASTDSYVLYATNILTLCSVESTIRMWFDTQVPVKLDGLVITSETCPTARDGSITAPPSNTTSISNLAFPNNPTETPSDLEYLASNSTSTNTYVNLESGNYVLTMSNPTSPYCLLKQQVKVPLANPKPVYSLPGQCSATDSLDLTISLSEGQYTTINYTVNGTSQINNGLFTNLPLGKLTLQVQAISDRCSLVIKPTSYIVTRAVITPILDNSVCNQLTINATSGNPSATLYATVESQF